MTLNNLTDTEKNLLSNLKFGREIPSEKYAEATSALIAMKVIFLENGVIKLTWFGEDVSKYIKN